VDPKGRELLTGMGNCFEACHDEFEGTVEMVANARGLSPEEVLARLSLLKSRDGQDPDYLRLRRRLPESFPF
jgi:hypothetical protein